MDQASALKRLREFVVARRRELNLTQAGLAAASGLSKPTLSRLEQGTMGSLPKVSSLEKLARGLSVRFEDLEELVTRGGGSHGMAMPRALVAVGDGSRRLLWIQALSRAGLAAVGAGDGENALAVVAYAEPDVLLLDPAIPVISGLDLLRHLRRDAGYRGPAVVVADDDHAEEAFTAAGADRFLWLGDPGFGVQTLVTEIRGLLSEAR